MLRPGEKYNDEDLFKGSTMTFGEHLEELRVCLFKAILGLVVGLLFGLAVGQPMVHLIERPLKNALGNYYQRQSLKNVQARLEELQEKGYRLPADPDELAEQVAAMGLQPRSLYINPLELAQILQATYPEQFRDFKHNEAKTGGFEKPNLREIFIWEPIEDSIKVTSLSFGEPFAIYMKVSLVVGAILASPWIFYQIWSFVAAGLYPHEKRYVHVFLPFSIGLFLAGVLLACLFVFEPVLNFLLTFNEWLDIAPDLRINEFLGFVLILPLGFGISFQLPLVMLFLERITIFSVKDYTSKWRMAVLVIFVISMILTPSDPYSMTLMAIPLTFLYFGGVLLCMFMPRQRSPYDVALAD